VDEAFPLQTLDFRPEKRQVSLGQLAIFFLRPGTTAFGGPAVHIAMMEAELFARQKKRRPDVLHQSAFVDAADHSAKLLLPAA
jgi:chromate transport protein ChrA